MRIAYVYDAVYPYILGGVERRVWELSHRLAKRGHKVHLYGMQWWDGEADIERDGVMLHGTCRPVQLYRGGKRTVSQAVRFGASVIPHLTRERFDVIDCQQFPYTSALVAVLASRISRSPLVITWHEVWGDYWYEYLGAAGAAGKLAERILARRSDHPVAVSETTRAGLLSAGVHKHVGIIPNGIDLPEIDRIRPSGTDTDMVFVGRLIREKHVDLLIRAIGILKEGEPGIRCLIIGDGPERALLEELVESCGVRENVRFTGFLQNSGEVISRMKSSRVFVLPSTREGFGIAALEALACGLPVITTDHPANASREFASGGCGRLVKLDPGDLARVLAEVLSSSGINRDTCRMRASSYDWDAVTDRIEDYYAGIISGSVQ
ncbi:MAG: glycosyltransferase family 4 protein [Methanoregulaceae archaeon]|jgi:glycosyltransferase involved in cell wall biosynthesis|nr:glycosyltransferase family 4 protein [Methanoregulaceae archaeon]